MVYERDREPFMSDQPCIVARDLERDAQRSLYAETKGNKSDQSAGQESRRQEEWDIGHFEFQQKGHKKS